MQPVLRFSRFLQRNMQLGNKIRSAVSILRLIDIRADRGTAAEDLLCQNCLVFRFDKIPLQPDDPRTKLYGLFDQNVLLQSITKCSIAKVLRFCNCIIPSIFYKLVS